MEYDRYTNRELIDEMVKLGLNPCPITSTTRNFIIKKLVSINKQTRETDIITCNDVSFEQPVESTLIESDNSFYGISQGENRSTPKVVRSLKMAVDIAKSSPSSRFKAFKSYEDAEIFSYSPQNCIINTSINKKEIDPVDRFLTIHPSLIIDFKRIISMNDYDEFIQNIESNPKYLITSNDQAVICHEGSRRNALHVAVSVNSIRIVKTIINKLKNIVYLSHFYHSTYSSAFEKSIHILDCYFNTPDKNARDTPLSIACKYGYIEIIELLLQEPLIDVNIPDSSNQVASEVICSRSNLNNIDLINSIKTLFDRYFVVVKYTDDFSITIETFIESFQNIITYFGPVNFVIANKILNKIKINIDPLELNKYYRSISRKYKCHCYEYFYFISTYIDLDFISSLELLEQFLLSYYSKNLSFNSNSNNFDISLTSKFDQLYIVDSFDSFNHHQTSINQSSNNNNNPIFDYNRIHLLFYSKLEDSCLQTYIKDTVLSSVHILGLYPNIHKYISLSL